MKTLCMDSAHRHLVIVLLEDGEVKAGKALSCWKQQSETLFPELIACMDSVGWKADDLDEVMITDGPGSYTGYVLRWQSQRFMYEKTYPVILYINLAIICRSK